MAKLNSLNEFRQKIAFADVLEALTELAVPSHILSCPLPDHTDDTPSFRITYDEIKGWRGRCFGAGCGWSGDVFALVKCFRPHLETEEQIIKHFFQEEARHLIDENEINLVNLLGELAEEEKQLEFWNRFINYCLEYRSTGANAAVAVTEMENWGIHPQVMRELPWGVFCYQDCVNSPEFSEQELKEYGIFPFKNDTESSPIVAHAFIYYRSFDLPSAIKLRQVNKPASNCKIVGPKNSLIGFYGINLIKNPNVKNVILVEGEKDVSVIQSRAFMERAEFANVICSSGSALKSRTAISSLENCGFEKLVVWPDNDKVDDRGISPGIQLVTDLAKMRTNRRLTFSVVWPEDYYPLQPGDKIDPADYMRDKTKSPTYIEVAKKLSASEKIIPKFLAKKAAEDYISSNDCSDKNKDRVRRTVVRIAVESDLWGFQLDDYIAEVHQLLPWIKPNSLFQEISRAYKRESAPVKIGLDTYAQKSDGYYKYTAVKKKGGKDSTPESELVQVTNFTVDVSQIVEFSEESMAGSQMVTRVSMPKGRKDCTLTTDDFSEPGKLLSKIRKVGLGQIICNKNTKADLENIINAFNPNPPITPGIGILGLNKIQGKWLFIYPQFWVEDGECYSNLGEDRRFYVHAPDGVSSLYDIPLIPLERDDTGKAKPSDIHIASRDMAINDFLNIYTDKMLPLSLLGAVMVAPIIHLLKYKKPALLIEGVRNSGKTHLVQFGMNFFANYPVRIASNVNASWTNNSVEVTFSKQCGVPQYIDDLKAEVVSQELKRFMGIIQNYHDSQGRGRLTRTLEHIPTSWIRGFLIMTGESLPTSDGGLLSRLLILNARQELYNEKLVDRILGKESLLGVNTPHYIAWIQRQGKLELQRVVDLHEKSRIDPFINILATGLHYYFRFLVEELQLSEKITTDLYSEWCSWMQGVSVDNFSQVVEQRDDLAFMSILEQLLTSGQYGFTDSVNVPSQKRIGYKKNSLVYIYQDLAIKAVQDVTPNKRWDKGSVTRLLQKQGWLNRSKNSTGIATAKNPEDNSARINVWVFSYDKLFPNGGPDQSLPDLGNKDIVNRLKKRVEDN